MAAESDSCPQARAARAAEKRGENKGSFRPQAKADRSAESRGEKGVKQFAPLKDGTNRALENTRFELDSGCG